MRHRSDAFIEYGNPTKITQGLPPLKTIMGRVRTCLYHTANRHPSLRARLLHQRPWEIGLAAPQPFDCLFKAVDQRDYIYISSNALPLAPIIVYETI